MNSEAVDIIHSHLNLAVKDLERAMKECASLTLPDVKLNEGAKAYFKSRQAVYAEAIKQVQEFRKTAVES